MRPRIYSLKLSDGRDIYFVSEVERDAAKREAAANGLDTITQEIPVPNSPEEFASFLNRQANN